MNRTFWRIAAVFIGIFIAAVIASVVYETKRAPVDRCERAGGAWDAGAKECRRTPQALCEARGDWWEPVTKTCAKVINNGPGAGRGVTLTPRSGAR